MRGKIVEKLARHLSIGAESRPLAKMEEQGKLLTKTLQEHLDNTLVAKLDPDPQEKENMPNRKTRAVRTGHFVRIEPTKLREPFLITYSKDMARELSLTEEMVKSQAFLEIFSADCTKHGLESWCTPYAVSVYGHPIPAPDHFFGYGYGDGRACSIGEFKNFDNTKRWELQLKGCGPTPFARSFDGRAVLRSSIREFLASEAMFHLGVPTTRALSLVGSGADFIDRAWYRPNQISHEYDYPPNTMVQERCAITTRACSSFLRVGQVELYQRRYRNGDDNALEGMEKFLRYCIEREYPEVQIDENELGNSLIDMLDQFAQRQAHLVIEWIRVGYVQGNMNSDNALLSGCTMDYGPFQFVQDYDPTFTPFTSDPERKFGFERQPLAAHVNLGTLAEALMPFLEHDEKLVAKAKEVVSERFPEYIVKERNRMRSAKLGLEQWMDSYDKELWQPLYTILRGLDYTLFWRELTNIVDDGVDRKAFLEKCSYDTCPTNMEKKLASFNEWLEKYLAIVKSENFAKRKETMLRNNPKFIPKEWMLVEAYEASEKGDHSKVLELQQLFEHPYDEQSKELSDKYYRTVPEEYRRRAGVAFFSCSS